MGVGGEIEDSYYGDPVSITFFNFSDKFFEIIEGEQFTQIVFEKISTPTLREFKNFEDSRTRRGYSAFGSTSSNS